MCSSTSPRCCAASTINSSRARPCPRPSPSSLFLRFLFLFRIHPRSFEHLLVDGFVHALRDEFLQHVLRILLRDIFHVMTEGAGNLALGSRANHLVFAVAEVQ